MSWGTAIYSPKGQNGLTCRHRQKDLALKLFEACARSFFILNPRKYWNVLLFKRKSPWSGGHTWQSQGEYREMPFGE
jgi:hypothetical protein